MYTFSIIRMSLSLKRLIDLIFWSMTCEGLIFSHMTLFWFLSFWILLMKVGTSFWCSKEHRKKSRQWIYKICSRIYEIMKKLRLTARRSCKTISVSVHWLSSLNEQTMLQAMLKSLETLALIMKNKSTSLNSHPKLHRWWGDTTGTRTSRNLAFKEIPPPVT